MDALIAEAAATQHGLVTTRQLVAVGLSPSSVSWRARHGRLHRVHRGVYAVGHPVLSREARWMAALLAVGDDAVLGRRSAADLQGFLRRPSGVVDILVPRRHRGVVGAEVCHARNLLPCDVTRIQQLPVTTPARTFVDLADVMTAYPLAHVLHEAAFRRKVDVRAIREVLERHRTRHSHPVAVRALELHLAGSAGTRSQLEERLLSLLLAAGVPEPLVNVQVRVPGSDAPIEVDFRWPDARLCVEVDGHGHDRVRTRNEDAARDALLEAAGFRVLRFAALAIAQFPDEVVDRVVQALAT